ncbi:MAG TPA: TonB-dependent receptor plug domain-containing protein, partial [Burkholderiaceae bacterium]|nr:TonB-dependent receptor plug domain-containing protein [Burkholderiaceae bacterium]
MTAPLIRPPLPARHATLFSLSICLSAGVAPLGALAQTTPPTTAESTAPAEAPELAAVEVRAARNTDEQDRRESTAAKTVIGREELERQGDGTIADVLKRQPGITLGGAPGRGGSPQMRGMGAYTQILLDGQSLPPGFSVENLTPSMVERIEILRAPTAETGARAIAGTINIVLRERLRAEPDDLKLGMGSEHGQPNLSADWVHHFKTESLQGMTALSLHDSRRTDDAWSLTQRDDGQTTRETERNVSDNARRGLHASARLQWQG